MAAAKDNIQRCESNLPTMTCALPYIDAAEYQEVEPYHYSGPLDQNQNHLRNNIRLAVHSGIKVRDLRGFESQLHLESHGFEFNRHHTQVQLRFEDEDLLGAYIDETVAFLNTRLSPEHLVCCDHRVSLCFELASALVKTLSIGTVPSCFSFSSQTKV